MQAAFNPDVVPQKPQYGNSNPCPQNYQQHPNQAPIYSANNNNCGTSVAPQQPITATGNIHAPNPVYVGQQPVQIVVPAQQQMEGYWQEEQYAGPMTWIFVIVCCCVFPLAPLLLILCCTGPLDTHQIFIPTNRFPRQQNVYIGQPAGGAVGL